MLSASALPKATFLQKMVFSNLRQFSVAYNVKDKFQEAYIKRKEQLAKNPTTIPQAKD